MNAVFEYCLMEPSLLPKFEGSLKICNFVAFSPDNITLALCGGNTVWLWNLKTRESAQVLEGHTKEIICVVFSPDGKKLVSCSRDETVRLWNVETGALIDTLARFDDLSWIQFKSNRIAFSPNGKMLAVLFHMTTVQFWDVETGKTINLVRKSHDCFRCFAFSPDGATLLSCCYKRLEPSWGVRVFFDQIECSSHKKTPKLGHIENNENDENDVSTYALEKDIYFISFVEFSPDRQTLAVVCDGTVELFNVRTGKLRSVLKGHKHLIVKVAFSPNGNILASLLYDWRVQLWDVKTGNPIETLQLQRHDHMFADFAFSPDNKTLAVSCGYGIIQLWHFWRPVQRSLQRCVLLLCRCRHLSSVTILNIFKLILKQNELFTVVSDGEILHFINVCKQVNNSACI